MGFRKEVSQEKSRVGCQPLCGERWHVCQMLTDHQMGMETHENTGCFDVLVGATVQRALWQRREMSGCMVGWLLPWAAWQASED